jgi:hypothetical protein
MNNDEVVLSRFVVNKVWEVAQACVDDSRKGWHVMMPDFGDAMDSLEFTAKEVREALAFLEARTYLITLSDEDGHVTGISLVPPRFRCEFCKMWLNTQSNPENHIDFCLRQQRKIERNRNLL